MCYISKEPITSAVVTFRPFHNFSAERNRQSTAPDRMVDGTRPDSTLLLDPLCYDLKLHGRGSDAQGADPKLTQIEEE